MCSAGMKVSESAMLPMSTVWSSLVWKISLAAASMESPEVSSLLEPQVRIASEATTQ